MAAKKAVYSILDLKGNIITGVGAPSLDSDVATKASAQAQASAAQAAAIAAAEADASTKATTAKSEAIAAAATDAQTKANTAQAAAILTAAADATSKAATAKTEAIAAAKTYTDDEISKLIASAPGALDTLNELAAALGDDANFASTVNTSITNINTSLATKLSIATGTATGGGTETSEGFEYTIAHNLNKANVIVQVFDGNDVVDVFIRKVNNNSLKLITGAALGGTTLTAVVAG